ncbi:DUF3888 domain-containing protein [Sporosarcina sp. Marseille-Q4063]|uniref:DUF3888 domain-containing protein n=1 Tax=Sporosarcina sp. Marseille-Q4063 TaxID=2810514 RepID=UPI001BAFC4E4|nr:DUF3888 domain-containing protein [Sporosarcina sp. Marseille-Q4063]QUW22620.1 DUF3888 domain-containing protein [Sporosarcina sp. Marseille-Q4063]
MRKNIIVPAILILALMTSIPSHAKQDYYQPAEKSEEELMMDLFFSLMSPTIDKVVWDYYANFLNERPTVYPYQINIINMERLGEYRSFELLITLEVTPVVGPHIEVGKDQLTFYITPSTVKLSNFKHIETYELPPNWKHIKKAKLGDSGLETY